MKTKMAKTILTLTSIASVALIVCSVLATADDQTKAEDTKIQEMRAGKNYIPTKVYTADEDRKMLKLFEGLRVADVIDGMDKAGLRNVGAMDPDIHPAWTDTKTFKHRFIGIRNSTTTRLSSMPHPPPSPSSTSSVPAPPS
ncbi:MAG: hypothetical protein ACYSU6_10265 [Planctomycetota bacterium]|jgi:hypothetical protein